MRGDYDNVGEDDVEEYAPATSFNTKLITFVAVLVVLIVAGIVTILILEPWDNSSPSQLEKSYSKQVQQILDASSEDLEGFNDLAYMCNTFGPRITGSKGLEDATQWAFDQMIEDGFDKVRFEETKVPNWIHNSSNDKLVMTSPYLKSMSIIPLGFSIGATGLTGEVVVVKSFKDLDDVNVTDKIVVYNVPFTSYGETVPYRTEGAEKASAAGAMASLTRSVTPTSLGTTHTGVQYYEDSDAIPAAAITVEDAVLLQYLQDQGETIILSITLDCNTQLKEADSHNVVGELTGTDLPNEYVVIGGHIDSWDVGTGAMDDAGGVFHAWQAMRILKELQLTPRRTIRLVLWTAEENGHAGSTQYFQDNEGDLNQTVFCLESDIGTFTPTGWSYGGNPKGMSTVQQISDLMKPTFDMEVIPGGPGVDIDNLVKAGVPGVGLRVNYYFEDILIPDKYFDYHHSQADTIDKIDLVDFQNCVGAVASLVYVIADMEDTLPRLGE